MSRRMSGLDADVRVLENHTAQPRHAETISGLRENLRVRFSVGDVFRGADRAEGVLEPGSGEVWVSIEPEIGSGAVRGGV